MHPIRVLGIILAAIVPLTTAAPATANAAPDVDTGRLVQLDTLGGSDSFAGAMNDRGDIAGASIDAEQNYQSAIWWHGRLSPTSLGVSGTAMAMNGNGHVVGAILTDDGSRKFLWRHGTLTYLRLGDGINLDVAAINEHDQVVGTAFYPDGTFRAFLWQQGRFTILRAPSGGNSVAVGIDNLGQVIGTGTVTAPGSPDEGMLWEGDRTISLSTPDGTAIVPVAINDRGQVVGNTADGRPFLWAQGRLTNLVVGTTAVGGQVTALSGTGIATGIARWSDGTSHAVLWRAGHMVDLGLPGLASYPQFVNDRGDVAGMVWLVQSHGVPFRWQGGHTTVFPDPAGDIATTVLGIDRHGTIGVSLETYAGFKLLRST